MVSSSALLLIANVTVLILLVLPYFVAHFIPVTIKYLESENLNLKICI